MTNSLADHKAALSWASKHTDYADTKPLTANLAAAYLELQAELEAEREAHKQTSRQANAAIEIANASCAVAEAQLVTVRAEVIKECADELLLEDWQEASHIVRALNEPAADARGQTQSLGEDEVPSEQPASAAATDHFAGGGKSITDNTAGQAGCEPEQAGEMAVRLADEAEAAADEFIVDAQRRATERDAFVEAKREALRLEGWEQCVGFVVDFVWAVFSMRDEMWNAAINKWRAELVVAIRAEIARRSQPSAAATTGFRD